MLKISKNLWFLSLFLLFGASKCEVDYSQNAQDFFASGKWPKALEDLANPKIDSETLEKILKYQTKHSGGIRVAVVDNGVDYFHPELYKRFEWQFDDAGNPTGVGRDFMGKDFFPHANRINPLLFSFGADLNESNKITNFENKPVEYYGKLSSEFSLLLEQKIKSSSKIKGTLFEKINATNFSYYGALQIIGDIVEDKTNFSRLLADYEKDFEDKELLDRNPEEKDFYKKYVERRHFKKGIDAITKNDWVMNPSSGLPFIPNFHKNFDYLPGHSLNLDRIFSIEGAPDFIKLLKEAFKEFNEKSMMKKALDPFLRVGIESSGQRVNERSLESAFYKNHQSLFLSWYSEKMKFSEYDPIVFIVLGLKRDLEDSALSFLENPKNSVYLKKKRLFSEINKMFENGRAIARFRIEADDIDPDKVKQFKKNIKKSHAYEKEIITYLKSQNLKALFQPGYSFESFRNSGKNKKFHRIANHPYLSVKSSTVSHGTHVSGIIARQSKKTKIVPIKVAISTSNKSKEQLTKIKNDFLNKVEKWLSKKLILKAIFLDTKFKKNIFDKIGEVDYQKVKDQKTIISYLVKVFKKFLKGKELGAFAHNYQSISEVGESIRYIGENKIKVANMSLGGDFEDLGASFDNQNQKRNERRMARFLIYEYYKYFIGSTIEKYAPHTLFTMAAGNSSLWVDGQAISSVPGSIFSEFLRKAEEQDEQLSKAPNNHIDNILTVMSLGPEEVISSFTNVPLASENIIFAEGEAIVSEIKTTDLLGSEDVVNKSGRLKFFDKKFDGKFKIKYFEQYPGLFDLAFEMGLIPRNYHDLDEETQAEAELDAIEQITELSNLREGGFRTEIEEALLDQACLDNLYCQSAKSGTSMAAPHAAGYAAVLIEKKLETLGIEEKESYRDPRFSPRQLIDDISSELPKYNAGRGMLKGIPILSLKSGKIKKPSKSKKAELETVLNLNKCPKLLKIKTS